MALNNTLKNVATKLIKKFGRSVTLITQIQGEYDPESGEEVTELFSTIQGLIANYQTKDYKEGLITMGDAPFYTTAEITKNHKLQFDNKKYIVTFIESYPADASIVLYYANIRTDGEL